MTPYARSGVSRAIALAVAIGFGGSTGVFAQSSERRVEVGGDLRWLTGTQIADAAATENSLGGAPRAVFRTTTRLGQAACPEATFSVSVTPIIDGEASIAFGRAHLKTRITGDAEAADATATEAVTEYLVEAGVAAHLARWNRHRAAPFASGGIGYLRQLHDGHLLVESGATFYMGGGLRYGPKNRKDRGWKSAGLRFEVRATILRGRLTLDGGTHILPAVIGGVFFHL